MYQIEDIDSAIKEVQRLLGIRQSGKYDKSTRDAVIDIQRINSLPKTGITDYTTFTAIVEAYREKSADILKDSFLFAPVFPFSKGDMGGNAGRINDALSLVLKSYSYEGVLPRGKYIGEDSISGARFLQGVFYMEERDEIDARFMGRLLLELDGIKNKEKMGIK